MIRTLSILALALSIASHFIVTAFYEAAERLEAPFATISENEHGK